MGERVQCHQQKPESARIEHGRLSFSFDSGRGDIAWRRSNSEKKRTVQMTVGDADAHFLLRLENPHERSLLWVTHTDTTKEQKGSLQVQASLVSRRRKLHLHSYNACLHFQIVPFFFQDIFQPKYSRFYNIHCNIIWSSRWWSIIRTIIR